MREAFEKADITGCEYLDVIDKRTKKPTKEIFQIKINPVLPNMIRDEYVYTQYVCPECGEPSIQTASPFFYRLSDFEEKYDFYLSRESIFLIVGFITLRRIGYHI